MDRYATGQSAVSCAEGLLKDGSDVWIGRHGVDRMMQITEIYVPDGSVLLFAREHETGMRIIMPLDELAVVTAMAD